VLNNRYPPKGDSGFHAHHRDLFAVVIQPSQSSGQALGKPLTPSPMQPAGAALYSAVGAEPRVHRIVNGDDSTFQIIVVELRRAKPAGTAISSRDAAPQYEQVFDNPRLRAWRLILAPPVVLDYVAAHEVAHLVHADHSPRFWAVVKSLVGPRLEGRAWLKAHGTDLHAIGR